MESLLYISDTPCSSKTGHGNMINAHYNMIKSIFGDNVIGVFAQSEGTEIDDKNYYFSSNNSFNKALSIFSGYPPYISKEMILLILKLLKNENIKYVFVENSISGNLIKKIKKLDKDICVISYFPDIESVLMVEQLKNANVFRKISLQSMIYNEKLTARYADKTIVLNKRDEELFFRHFKKRPSLVVPVIVPDQEICINKVHFPNDPLEILFVGADYYPNVYGVEWFLTKVTQKIKIKFNLTVVGNRMEKYKEKWEKYKNVNVLGTVDDLSFYYNRCDVVIAPIFDGGGMKVKTAEAFSFGKRVIGTTESTFGYWENSPELQNTFLFKCDNEIDFSNVINNLGKSGFNGVSDEVLLSFRNNYSMDANIRKMKKLFSTLD